MMSLLCVIFTPFFLNTNLDSNKAAHQKMSLNRVLACRIKYGHKQRKKRQREDTITELDFLGLLTKYPPLHQAATNRHS